MSIKVCFVYPWATLGGVERVLLSRLIAFKSAQLDIQVDVMFFCDVGGAVPLENAMRRLGINGRVAVAEDFEPDVNYDLVFCIDCPQAFDLCERRSFRYVVECHTPYVDNRRYLKSLPAACELIIAPSDVFRKRIDKEINKANYKDVVVLRNFIPWDTSETETELDLPKWKRTPIVFFARMDKNKDPVAVLDAFALLDKQHPSRFMCILCGPPSPEIDIHKEVRKRNIVAQTMVLPPIPFDSASVLLKAIKSRRGIFVSPSKGESFGLSAAEAISAEIPVVLSDIEEHRWLVQPFEANCTYELGDSVGLAERILEVADNYEHISNLMLQLREKLSVRSFLLDWNSVLDKLTMGDNEAHAVARVYKA